MASLNLKKVLLLLPHLIFIVFTSILLLCVSSNDHQEIQTNHFFQTRRILLEIQNENLQKSKNQTKLIISSSKNKTKLIDPNPSFSKLKKLNSTSQLKFKKLNSTSTTNSSSILKFKKLNSNSTISKLKKLNSTSQFKSKKPNSTSTTNSSSVLKFKKLNSNSTISNLKKLNSTSKPTNSTKISSISKKSTDLIKLTTSKNKPNPEKKVKKPTWLDDDDDEDDFVSDFKDLPLKFQQNLIPDLEKISTTSKAYITKYNKQITRNFNPIVGKKYAQTIATLLSFAFIIIPLILVSLIFNRIKAYFSLQKLLIFIQVYLAIYFSILCVSTLVTSVEPLKFFYATSQSTYICIQVLQTLGYVLYLLMLLMYLILVFSTDCGLGSKMVGLAQTSVGFAVGLHYYVAVFHRTVLRQPPKTNWKVHGVYATCFVVVCLFSNAERRKKAYLEEKSGEEGKKN